MYYEEKKKDKSKLVIYIFFIIIIALLAILIIKTETNNSKVSSAYNAEKLNLSEENILIDNNENNVKNINIIEKSVKAIVGISKLKRDGSLMFVDNVEEKLGLGSGVIITDNGYILTNQHVAGNKYSNCYVSLEDGKTYEGNVVWEDSNIDLAIVKIVKNGLNYLSLGDSDNIKLAQNVYAIGNPIGMDFQRTVTKGIISSLNRTIKIEAEGENVYMEDLIQTDSTINQGNSGGALINENGELIGINSVKISNAEGIGFAVPVNIVKPIINKLVNNGKFEEAWLGISGYDKEAIKYIDATIKIENGVYVAQVAIDGPLLGIDVQVGDIITQIDSEKINKMNDLKKYIYEKNPGDIVKLHIQRKGREKIIDVKLNNKI